MQQQRKKKLTNVINKNSNMVKENEVKRKLTNGKKILSLLKIYAFLFQKVIPKYYNTDICLSI